jgi:hypothetical protein
VRRWIITAAVLWGLVVAGLGYWSLRHDKATAREQTTIASALPVVDAAIADTVAALDPQASVTAVSGYTRVGRTCSVTAAREGTRYERFLLVFVKHGTEPEVLDTIRKGLPERYKATLGKNVLDADAGNFVRVRGGVLGGGQVRVSADTGCRVQDDRVGESIPAPDAANKAPVQAVLDTLKLTADSWASHQVKCANGEGALWTVEASTGARTAPDTLPESLRPAGGLVLGRPDAVAYRSGPAAVSIRKASDHLVITSTTGC